MTLFIKRTRHDDQHWRLGLGVTSSMDVSNLTCRSFHQFFARLRSKITKSIIYRRNDVYRIRNIDLVLSLECISCRTALHFQVYID